MWVPRVRCKAPLTPVSHTARLTKAVGTRTDQCRPDAFTTYRPAAPSLCFPPGVTGSTPNRRAAAASRRLRRRGFSPLGAKPQGTFPRASGSGPNTGRHSQGREAGTPRRRETRGVRCGARSLPPRPRAGHVRALIYSGNGACAFAAAIKIAGQPCGNCHDRIG